MVTAMETGRSMSRTSGAPSARSLLTSFGLHALALGSVLLVPVAALGGSARPQRQVHVVFYRRPQIAVPARAVPIPLSRGANPDGRPLGPGKRDLPPGPLGPGKPDLPPGPLGPGKPDLPPGPLGPGDPDLPPGPEEVAPIAETPRQKVEKAGILAFKDTFESLSRDNATLRLGADARYGAADDEGQPSSRSMLAANTPGSSGGINLASLSLRVGVGGGGGRGGSGRGGGGGGGIGGGGVGGGGGGGGGGGFIQRVEVASPITPGGDRPLAQGGLGPSRTDEEIQIVFDRYKASFYRLYNLELRKDPTLQGQMVLRLTIEPDGSVSMCVLQSTDMNAPALAAQVVNRVRTINFGAKEGVQALTIVYPIDFLPAYEAGG